MWKQQDEKTIITNRPAVGAPGRKRILPEFPEQEISRTRHTGHAHAHSKRGASTQGRIKDVQGRNKAGPENKTILQKFTTSCTHTHTRQRANNPGVFPKVCRRAISRLFGRNRFGRRRWISLATLTPWPAVQKSATSLIFLQNKSLESKQATNCRRPITKNLQRSAHLDKNTYSLNSLFDG